MVAAELRKPDYSRGVQLLVIRNYGPSIARNVTVSFDPPVEDPEVSTGRGAVTSALVRRYRNPIPLLTPGAELSNVYVAGSPVNGVYVNDEPTPAKVIVIIRYKSDDGDQYEDRFPLDTDLIRKGTIAESSHSPHNLAKQSEKHLRKISAALDSLTRIGRGLMERQTGQEEGEAPSGRGTPGTPEQGPGQSRGHQELAERLVPHRTEHQSER